MGEQLPAPTLVLAVDAGGTSCRTAAVAPDGTCWGLGFAGSANPLSTADADAAGAVVASALAALEQAETGGDAVALVLVAAAGGGHRPEFLRLVSQSLAQRGIEARIRLEADGLAAFCSGTHEGDGCVLVAGTGAVALRVEGGRNVRSVDGLGWLLGDIGSGFWVGQRVVRAVLAHLDGTGPATALTPLLVAAMGLGDLAGEMDAANGRSRLVHEIGIASYAELPVRLARHASLAFDVPEDPVASGILDEAAAGLATTLRTAMASGVPGPVIVAGGLLAGPAGLRDRLGKAMGDVLPVAGLVPVVDGVVGACVLALRELGADVDAAVFERIAGTVAAHRG
ncbi:BadF/BadG/BcrA/BcrD ATPase family protein [Tessaracoccus terricola]